MKSTNTEFDGLIDGNNEWKVAYDPRTHRPYYYHPVTRETRWTNPMNKSNIRDDQAKFFESMESNIRAKIRQGKLSFEVLASESKESKRTDTKNMVELSSTFGDKKPRQTKLFRTLSSVDDSALSKYSKAGMSEIQCPSPVKEVSQKLEFPVPGQYSYECNRSDEVCASHRRKRSNTTSTIYVPMGTMSSPDKDATILCVSTVIRAHILEGLKDPIPISSKFEAFNTRGPPPTITVAPPLQEVVTFMRIIHMKGQLEPECIIMTLIYIEQLLKQAGNQLQIHPKNWRSILFSAMIMASKVWDDLSMWNADFSKICPAFTLSRVNELELLFLDALKYNVKVSASSYAKYYFHLRAMSASVGLRGQFGDLAPLDLEGAKKLQVLSLEYEERMTESGSQRRRSATITSGLSVGNLEDIRSSGYKYSKTHSPSASIEQLVYMNVR